MEKAEVEVEVKVVGGDGPLLACFAQGAPPVECFLPPASGGEERHGLGSLKMEYLAHSRRPNRRMLRCKANDMEYAGRNYGEGSSRGVARYGR
jgi:hypothetical protein